MTLQSRSDLPARCQCRTCADIHILSIVSDKYQVASLSGDFAHLVHVVPINVVAREQ